MLRPALRGVLPALLAGALMASGQAPLGLWWLALPALWWLMAQISGGESLRTALWRGWMGGTGYFAAALFWIVEPFMVDAARQGWMAPFALVFLATGMALFWALAAGVGWGLGRGRSRPVALAVSFAAVELMRGYVLTGFPWALIGHVWIDTPVVQAAAYVGPVGLTLLTTLLAALPLVLRLPGAVVGAVVIGLLWLGGLARLGEPLPPRAAPIHVRLVQPNIPQHLKWAPALIGPQFRQQLEQTAMPADPPPDLTIWPETALVWLLEDAAEPLAMIAEASGGRPVALGVQRGDGGRYYNSLAVLDRTGQVTGLYDKHHLVPFGEYIPFGDIAARFGIHGLAAREGDGYSPGPGPAILDLGPLGKMLPLICYEAVFPQDLRGAPDRADWILQVTNDAWFGNLSGPYQHLAQARLRAVEQGLPLIRAANTGVSAIIDARGAIVSALPLNVEGTLDGSVPAALPPTPYARMGDLPMAGLILMAGAGLLLLRRRERD